MTVLCTKICFRNRATDALARMAELRREQPAKFCLVSCLAFSTLAYVGTFLSALGLFYYSAVAALVRDTLVVSLKIRLSYKFCGFRFCPL